MDADLFRDEAAPVRRTLARRACDGLRALRPPRWLHSLKARLMLGSLLTLLLSLLAVTWQMGRHAEAGLLRQAQDRQLAEAERTSAALAHGLSALTAGLAHFADITGPARWSDPEAVADDLARHLMPGTALSSVFVGQSSPHGVPGV